ncbi:MAG TPA: hypothetical protein PL017_10560 [Tenuifilaceae bacterium]|nr:hypothetical protein [Tenuifilaceae bacterium]HPE19074.1 hypothetical protein [Tenuifilaceae bacterium]HPJ46528.1 hypothetical protein [Tenuifilaceae bacterium]HPQ34920.1 hypothetical protein [Tenuifilaceae bacterium]HRX68849.1 hypothetical protein [Tenuifilaceae bacterium]
MKKIILFSFLLLLLSGCCFEDDVEVARYNLSEEELSLIPYTQGQEVIFMHSNGYEFVANVENIETEWERYYDFCEWFCCGQDYFSYEVKRVYMNSTYPSLNMRIRINESYYGDYHPMGVHFDINHRHFLSIPYDSSGTFVLDYTDAILYDSIVLNNKVYRCVVEKPFDFHMFTDDSTVVKPQSILYNSSGLLQIIMSNNETYTVQN